MKNKKNNFAAMSVLYFNISTCCGFQGNSTHRQTKDVCLYTIRTHHAGVIIFMLTVTGIESLPEEGGQKVIITFDDSS